MPKLSARKTRVKELRDKAIALRVKSSLKGALDAAAEQDHRTVAGTVEMMIEASLRARGFLKQKGELK